jgi:hypothetical protein
VTSRGWRDHLERVWSWLEQRYDQRRVWCHWCQDAPAGSSGPGYCSAACQAAQLYFNTRNQQMRS